VSKPARNTESTKLDKLPFETALQKLEDIVEAMETGDLPLESLLVRYEEGVKLAKACQGKLAAAEIRIQELERAADGALKLKPMTVDTASD
jgi:exodeoxyribonuclease VII small subunit